MGSWKGAPKLKLSEAAEFNPVFIYMGLLNCVMCINDALSLPPPPPLSLSLSLSPPPPPLSLSLSLSLHKRNRLLASFIAFVTTTLWKLFLLVFSAPPSSDSREHGRRCLRREESKKIFHETQSGCYPITCNLFILMAWHILLHPS